MANFSPGWNFSLVSRTEISARLLEQILMKSNWRLHREGPSPGCNTALAENPIPFWKTGLGFSAPANGLIKQQKSHVIETEFQPGLKNRIRLSSTLQRRKRSPKTESYENALQSGAIWKRCFSFWKRCFLVWTVKTMLSENGDAIQIDTTGRQPTRPWVSKIANRRFHVASLLMIVVVWTGENDTKTISVDANLFENGAKQLRFRLKTD